MITVIKTCDHCKKDVTHLYEWPRFTIKEDIISISQMGTYQYCKDCCCRLRFSQITNCKTKRMLSFLGSTASRRRLTGMTERKTEQKPDCEYYTEED